MKKYKIALLVGSLRKESFNRKVAKELIRLQPESLEMEIVEIGDLPLYNEDLDGDNPPAEWTTFRKKNPIGRWSTVCNTGIQPLYPWLVKKCY